MGKKTKQGKSRKDKFYFLAKESGYRARSAFKLIQLNRRFNFLGSSKVLIDLCAAPGGWMQVASKEMPINSVIVGVDLMPILPIPNCKSIVADITTEKCRQLLKAAVLSNKADVVLHDGAPNVGTAWTIDEYSQASLCLKAFALATDFLRKGGWFVTKVFRSRDYEPLKWAISQFFRKMRVLKPEASRLESAEIFLIGQGYLDPSHIDPKFLDPRHVFGEVEVAPSRETVVSVLMSHTAKKKKAEGYDDDKLYHETKLSEFFATEDPLKCLAQTNKIINDRDDLMNHSLTPFFIKDSMMDIQVLGKAEIRALLTWRRKVTAALEAAKKANEPIDTSIVVDNEEPGSADEEEETQKEVERLLKDENQSTKKRLKNIRKAKRKLAERVVLKMEHPGDVIEQNNANELFSLASIDLDKVEREEARILAETGHTAADLQAIKEEKAIKSEVHKKRATDFQRAVEGGDFQQFDRHADHDIDLGTLESTRPKNVRERDDLYLSSSSDEGEDSEGEDVGNLIEASDDEGDDSDDAEIFKSDDDDIDEYAQALNKNISESGKRSLLTDLDPTNEETKNKRKIDSWCNSSELKDLMAVEESDREEEVVEKKTVAAKRQAETTSAPQKQKKPKVSFADEMTSSKAAQPTSGGTAKEDEMAEDEGPNEPIPDSQDSDTSDDEPTQRSAPQKLKKKIKKLRRPLTAQEKAIAVKLIQSTKSRRDLLEWNFHRYRFFENEESLPDWFSEDEKRHMRKTPHIEKEVVDMPKPVQGKTLKKAEEAKARKKMKMARRLSSVRRRAENLPEDLSEKETWSKIKTMYKTAGLLKNKKRPVHYVVNSKQGAKNQEGPPRGAKVRLVDRRMKSDLRGMYGKGGKSSGGRGKAGGGRGRAGGGRGGSGGRGKAGGGRGGSGRTGSGGRGKVGGGRGGSGRTGSGGRGRGGKH